MIKKILGIFQSGNLWMLAVSLAVNKDYLESLKKLEEMAKIRRLRTRHYLLMAFNQYWLGEYHQCDSNLRGVLERLDDDSSLSESDRSYVRAYIKSIYGYLEKASSIKAPKLSCPNNVSKANVNKDLVELFPLM